MIRVGERRMGAVGGKTARACDICVRKRARWYCAADDAFLCQVCDESVHSANPLARRHDRLRLNTASLRHYSSSACKQQLPTWHRGPTRKPRTPRQRKKHHHHQQQQQQNHPVVPELDTWMDEEEEDEDQLLCRVPVYDHHSCPLVFPGPSELDMAEFAADVEALLGKGLDGDHSCGIEDLGLLINSHAAGAGAGAGPGPGAGAATTTTTTTTVADCGMLLKLENEEEMEVFGEPFQLTFDYDSPEEGDCGDVKDSVCRQLQGIDSNKQRKMLLKLDYDAISTAWGRQGSPWINGNRPSDIINPDYCSHLTPTGGYGIEMKAYGEAAIRGDVGREARVSRYREKRRTRLFSKKIRYEVRKLNAEKRPRMKGRFVKRSSFPLLTNSE